MEVIKFNSSKEKSPVYFNKEEQMQKEGILEKQYCSIQPQYNYNAFRNDTYNQEYNYDKRQNEIYNTTGIKLQMEYEHKQKMEDLKISSDVCKQLISSDIYKNFEGRLVYVKNYPNGMKMIGKELLNARDYETCLYFSNYPNIQKILEVSWNSGEHNVYFDYCASSFKINAFLQKLNLHGLHLLVSERAKKEAASALLAYSVKNAEKIELPFDYGWWKDTNKQWRFAQKDALTMKGVRNKIEW